MIPHNTIMKSISEKVGDPRLLELIKKFIGAGFIDEAGIHHKPKLGTPQGGVLSPLLANIVLHKLDEFMAQEKIRFDTGTKRRKNPEYAKLQAKKAKTQDPEEKKSIMAEMRNLRRSDFFDKAFRRIFYVRYADDFVVLIVGDKKNALYLKSKIREILKAKCGLELNEDKTIINSMTEK